jgi:outer membrane protein OmpA-like peptidoglycan-associated protein
MRYPDLPMPGLVLAACALTVAACSEPPARNAALDQARASYSNASGNPEIARYGSYPLAEAHENLTTAQTAFAQEQPERTVTHYANLANTQSAIAADMARRRQAEGESAGISREITLGDMLFRVGKADLNSQGTQAVGEIAAFMKNHPDRTVAVNGYTDSTGSMKLNEKLSLDRAKSVQTALVGQGIAPDRIAIQGHGPSNPVASNATASGREKNRRVVVDISGPTTAGMGSSTPTQ